MTITLIVRPDFLGVPENYRPEREVDPKQFTGTPAEQAMELAARVCYDSVYKGRESARHQANIKATHHWNVTRAAVWSFLVTDVSRPLSQELIRHHVGTAISQRSTRYVDEKAEDIAEHPLLRDIATTRYLSDKTRFRIKLTKIRCQETYDMLLEDFKWYFESLGVDKKRARKQARGAARFFLPMGLKTEFVWTANTEAIMNVITKRDSEHADQEIAEFARELHGIMRREAPRFFETLEYS